MTTLGSTTLENEMDLTLAYKKSILVADKLGLTAATQTAFATAVSEVCRDVIDKATDGLLIIGTAPEEGRFALEAIITYNPTDKIPHPNPGYEYAKKLVPVFNKGFEDGKERVTLSLTMPRSLNLSDKKIQQLQTDLLGASPINSYEEVKLRNSELQQANLQHELELVSIKYLNEQKKEFLSIASHEINGPLTVAHSMAQIALKLDPKTNPALTGYLQRLHLHTTKLVRLTRQLLDISRMETGNFNYEREVITAPLFFDEVIENLKLLCPDHHIAPSLSLDLALLNIDKIKIEQVFNNVVGNAAKYSDPGTTITIHANCTAEQLVVTVRDQGIGMSEDTLSRVFSKFYRGKNERSKFSGLGMGLYVTARIIEDHNGSLTASSVPGEGSAFTFRLPLHQA
ncbi:HAMP domain-containing sensor histidine kinase [Niabella yanshanensis]|uniref:histidine kinase n=1 Tax=Niabella yanshanensis TaxID=577386 RepID=A0ABZ0WBQ3_9BACT|nr:HAMP domain-containing sensor histidine kinase [Niabella yanshanensis]WQD39600.1 HAMP domain-containing sensor histidine kinase [Niabella yanshanensis]